VIPSSLATTFELDPTQPYFAFAMKGEIVPDTLKITFINQDGTNYSEPIVVEYLRTGQNVIGGTDFRVTTLPKRIETGYVDSYYAKPIDLTNFIINTGDYLILEVIPNTGITQTSWDLYFTCLDNFSCDTCLETNSIFKLSASTITSTILSPCDNLQVGAQMIGCPSYENEDIFKFMHSVSNQYLQTTIFAFNGYTTQGQYINIPGNASSPTLSFNGNCSGTGGGSGINCQETPGNTINFTKVGSLITITCSSQSDRDAYYDSYTNIYSQLTGWNPGPPSPTTLDYYQYIQLSHIVPLSPNSTCGDNQYTSKFYKIHPSSMVTPGGVPGAYTITIDMETITNQYPLSTCNSCYSIVSSYVSNINSDAAQPDVTNITTNGLRYDIPFNAKYLIAYTTPTSPYGLLGSAELKIPYYSTITLPYSGNSLTVIPSLSATTCDFGWMDYVNEINPTNGNEAQFFKKEFANYWVVATDPNNVLYFEIRYGGPTGTAIYEVNSTYPLGNIIDPSYFV
jgi:hypothetical protein